MLTARVYVTMRLRGRGIRRIPRADQTAAAAKAIYAAPVATGYSIVLQHSEPKRLQDYIMDDGHQESRL